MWDFSPLCSVIAIDHGISVLCGFFSSELLNNGLWAACFVSHYFSCSVGSLVIGNTHICFTCLKVCHFPLYTVDTAPFTTHLFFILLICTVCCVPAVSHSLSLCQSLYFSSPALSIAFYSFSASLFTGVSDSWSGTGCPWQEVCWLVLRVTLHSSGSLLAK